eukprot:CAMPEP_0183322964 /NCGR_PEP_ID=MMETSP0160_2-20130417/73195_1 /TAXON_ID=2839 ORGANISM="Odontella Sinensis, Strain Grunow 1884" /NCGR_SAMPLE_ID=MMETSP0160_2 /ASSEMBLY_ACC=CAM_ASM_000250 /LENGTH=192 /DNA_ID=CAMNT_0025490249 /DNA_START=56 /DNA_END=631 /DNA_ORIENTATION=-
MAAMSVTVESRGEECFVIRSPSGRQHSISGNFDCLDDGLSPRPVSVRLYDPKMRAIWTSRPDTSEGSFRVVGEGRYQLCISNGIKQDHDKDAGQADGLDRTIGFAVRVRDLIEERREMIMSKKKEQAKEGGGDKEIEEAKSKSVEKAQMMGTLTEDLVERLNSLRDHQAFLRERDEIHRDLAESTFGLLIRW